MTPASRFASRARALAEAVPAIFLAMMFVSFIIQVFMRYVVGSPVGWTVEVCVMAWLWILLWGQSVSAREEDEIRFDILYGAVSPQWRRRFRLTFSVLLVGIYAWSLPALWDFVTFMKIQKTTYLDIRFNWVYSIAILFSVASILRYLRIFWASARGSGEPKDGTDTVTRADFNA